MLFDGLGFQPWRPPAVLASVEEGGAGQQGGLEAGDRITSIDGETVGSFGDLQRIVSERPGKDVVVELVREPRRLVANRLQILPEREVHEGDCTPT